MNILITGANGQLGNEIRRAAKGAKDNYVFTDIDLLDICNKTAVEKTVEREKAELIVNCAAYTDVDRAEKDEEKAHRLNCLAVRNLAEVAKKFGAVLIHVSTDYVFDGRSCVPYTEEQECRPTGVYGKTKYEGERAIVDSGCKYIIIRTSWLYSVWGKNFVKTMLGLTKDKDNIGVVFDQVGTPTFAGDLARAVVRIVEKRLTDRQGIYHFSNEGVSSWYDFALEICKLAKNKCGIEPIHSKDFPSKVERPHFSVLDKSKFKQTFGCKIPHWRQSLEGCVEELLEKQETEK